MNDGRWYPSNCTLANGATLVASGSIDDNFQDTGIEGYPYRVNELPQVYETNGQFRSLTSALLKLPLYPMLHLAPNGKVFVSGPDQTTRYLDTTGTGAWTTVGSSNFGPRPYGSSVMYGDGKVLIIGSGNTPTATAEVIDLNQSSPTWRYVSSMANPRTRPNATTLPDGKVFVTGGHSGPGFSPGASAVLASEMWDPVTESWSIMASMSEARLHHSMALLLPDARVLISGGGQPTANDDYDHHTAEFYSPPYLFKGVRPTITTTPTSVNYGQTFSVETPDAANIEQVTWIRLPAVTHHFDQNQRINRLNFTRTAGGLNVTAPANGTLCPPGHYMLFILNSNGVPSVAKIIQIGTAPGSIPSAPSTLTATAASSTQINLAWTDNSANEDGFKVERCQGTGCTNFAEIAQIAANVTSYNDTGRSASTTYVYRVRAYNASGNSGYSNTAQATTQSAPPAAPSNLTATAVSSSQINLTWTDNATNEDGFKIERCQGAGCTNFIEIATAAANASSYNDAGRTAGTTYVYRVRAFNNSGDSAYSNTAQVTTQAAAVTPAAPSNLTATSISTTQINLTWTDNSNNESGFKVERSVNGTTFTEIGTVGVGVTSYSDGGLTANTFYYYRVRAYNTVGNSAYSNTVKVKTKSR